MLDERDLRTREAILPMVQRLLELGPDRAMVADLVAGKLTDVERQIAALEHARDLLTHASTCRHDDLLACPGFQEWFAGYLATFPDRERT